MTALASTVQSRFEIGRVFTQTFAVIGRNWAALAPISLCLAVVPIVLIERAHVWLGNPSDPIARFGQILLLDSVLCVAATAPFYAAVSLLTASDLERKPMDFGRLLVRTLAVSPVVIVTYVISVLAMTAGMLLLVIPGIIILLAWNVALPAAAVEGCGPFQALGRSTALTRGSRWAIFAVILVVGIPGGIIGYLGAHFLKSAGPDGYHTWPMTEFKAALAFFTYPFGGVFTTAVYFELRRLREGALRGELAEVFA